MNKHSNMMSKLWVLFSKVVKCYPRKIQKIPRKQVMELGLSRIQRRLQQPRKEQRRWCKRSRSWRQRSLRNRSKRLRRESCRTPSYKVHGTPRARRTSSTAMLRIRQESPASSSQLLKVKEASRSLPMHRRWCSTLRHWKSLKIKSMSYQLEAAKSQSRNASLLLVKMIQKASLQQKVKELQWPERNQNRLMERLGLIWPHSCIQAALKPAKDASLRLWLMSKKIL